MVSPISRTNSFIFLIQVCFSWGVTVAIWFKWNWRLDIADLLLKIWKYATPILGVVLYEFYRWCIFQWNSHVYSPSFKTTRVAKNTSRIMNSMALKRVVFLELYSRKAVRFLEQIIPAKKISEHIFGLNEGYCLWSLCITNHTDLTFNTYWYIKIQL